MDTQNASWNTSNTPTDIIYGDAQISIFNTFCPRLMISCNIPNIGQFQYLMVSSESKGQDPHQLIIMKVYTLVEFALGHAMTQYTTYFCFMV